MRKAPRVMGAVFAGGRSRRFGSDKATARIDGVPMIERVAARLVPQCAAVAVVGRDWPGHERVDDLPAPGLGPLGALAGAMVGARSRGCELLLTSGCDLPDVPTDLLERLRPADAVVAGQPLLGLWHSAHADRLLAYLADPPDRSLRGWIAAAGARTVALPQLLANINTPGDLARYVRRADPPPSR